MPDGGAGLRCGDDGACGNPCLAGTGPEEGGTYCSKLCKLDKDCPGGTCAKNGVCDLWSHHALKCDDPALCVTPTRGAGQRCKEGDPCLPVCKIGLVLAGGTHCAKPCKTNKDCPKGECDGTTCGPLCPAEGCPYLWE
jgi:hypothetical protein